MKLRPRVEELSPPMMARMGSRNRNPVSEPEDLDPRTQASSTSQELTALQAVLVPLVSCVRVQWKGKCRAELETLGALVQLANEVRNIRHIRD